MSYTGSLEVRRHRLRRDAAASMPTASDSIAQKKDKWGLPVLKIDCATGENERLMRKDMIDRHGGDARTGRRENVKTFDSGSFPGMGIHEMGTARMGRDPKTSVFNAHNQVWDAPNVFVTDGSVHGFERLPESLADVHGAHRSRGGFCGGRTQSPQSLRRP